MVVGTNCPQQCCIEAMERTKTKKTIMIVEDDPFIAMDLEDTFLESGFEVVGPFANVHSGLKALKECLPDVAMLDYNLGLETSIPLAEVLYEDAVPYLFLSGQVDRVIIDHNLPPRPIITKPFVAEKLVGMVNNLINSETVSVSNA